MVLKGGFVLHVALCSSQGHETSALLILEKISDRNLINCTNTALQTYVVFPGCRPTLMRYGLIY